MLSCKTIGDHPTFKAMMETLGQMVVGGTIMTIYLNTTRIRPARDHRVMTAVAEDTRIEIGRSMAHQRGKSTTADLRVMVNHQIALLFWRDFPQN